ncbi:MAG: HlyU family transcriptional regulator [Acidiferrobacterales bacterium]|nr:HlyU family transcriptional regulator [Acidiferrobacterales bacterium]
MGLFDRILGKGETRSAPQPELEDYEGYQIKPAPLKQQGSYNSAGYIYKADESGTLQEHYFIRADTHTDFETACEHSVFKAKQIINESGDRIFERK